MRHGVIPELDDKRVTLQFALHHRALDAATTTMNQPDFSQPGGMRGAEILTDNVHDIPRRKRMKVERAFDRNVVHGPIVRRRLAQKASGFSPR